MWAAAIRIELRILDARSLKAKRAVLRPHVERLRRMASLSVAEIGHHDAWQRSVVGVAIVAPDRHSLEAMIEKVRRYVDIQLDVELVEFRTSYLEDPE